MRNHPDRFEIKRKELIGAQDGSAFYDWGAATKVVGRISVEGVKELSGAPEVQDMQATVAWGRVPLSTSVAVGDQLEVITPTHPMMAGPWMVAAVKVNRDHAIVALGRLQ